MKSPGWLWRVRKAKSALAVLGATKAQAVTSRAKKRTQ
jgi:hypothetical protein